MIPKIDTGITSHYSALTNFTHLKMVTLPMWIPSPLSRAEGREIEKLSLLGPFLSLSVFSEDCVSF